MKADVSAFYSRKKHFFIYINDTNFLMKWFI